MDHPAFYPVTGSWFHVGKSASREADHSSPSSAKVKKDGAIAPFPHTFSSRGT
jgi:hypothetical protein